MLKVHYFRIILFPFLLLLSLFVVANPITTGKKSGYTAGNISVDLEGRGLYLKTKEATYDGNGLTLQAPQAHWLGDMRPEHLEALKNFDLGDLNTLAETLSAGLRHTTILEVSVEYQMNYNSLVRKILDVKEVNSKNGNLSFILKGKTDLPEDVGAVTVLFKTWPHPTAESRKPKVGGKWPDHALCCDCSGGCAALWILFAWCKTCLAVEGGQDCCSQCHMPPNPGGSCI